MASSQPNSPLLKGFALTSTIYIASALGATSAIFIPSLLRPLQNRLPGTSTPSTTRPSSSLNVPQSESGRLTPSVSSNRGFDFGFPFGHSGTYKAVAQQFASMDARAFRFQVPFELLTIAAYGVIAYRSRSARSGLWKHWAAAAGLLAAVFPFTGAMMVPLGHKIMRIGGDEEKIEPYEDAPIDREMEKSNTVEFLGQWNTYNIARTLSVFTAGVVAVRALVLE